MQFATPKMIYSGAGTLDALVSIPAVRAMLVTDKNMLNAGHIDRAVRLLEEHGTEALVFSDIAGEPGRSTVDKAVAIAKSFAPDLIVGIGGGSVIDVGKAIWAFCELPELTWDAALEPFALPRFPGKIHYIAVPSTSGTGSETGTSAVVMDDRQRPSVKQWIDSYEIIPDIAILDPELCKTMPPSVTANTGFDALSHAIEAYAATGANELSDCLAQRAVALIFTWLLPAVREGSNLPAREKMHLASAMAGMAFNNAGLGLMHAMAHQLGAQMRVPHGMANALVMPYVVAFNCRGAANRYAGLARTIGITGSDERDMTMRLITALQKLRCEAGIPMSIREAAERCGTDTAFDLELLAQKAMLDGCAQTNPRDFTTEDLRQLYREAYQGSDPLLLCDR